jgi:hypothetical protein
MPVSAFVAVKLALTTAAPLESVTVPEMLPPTPAHARMARNSVKPKERQKARRPDRLKVGREKFDERFCAVPNILKFPS